MNILTSIPVVNSDLTVRELDDEMIILAEAKEEIHNLTGTAVFIWKLFDGSNTTEFILNKLCSEYDVSIETGKADVIAFIEECVGKQLISLQEGI